jgi:hypothetical protein
MRSPLLYALVFILAPSIAHAATCEESFTKTGSIISGQKFGASVTVPDLSPSSAIGQLRGIVIMKNYDVMAAEPEDGSMLIEQPQTAKARAFPITITASPDGTVRMDAKLPIGMTANADSAKNEFCGMLNRLKGGGAGNAAAATGIAAVATKAPLELDSLSLSHQISKDTQRNPAAAAVRYQGKSFIVSGTVKSVDKVGDSFVVSYDIPEPYQELLRLPNTAPFKTDLVCRLAPSQTVFALQLRPGKNIKLTGDYENFDPIGHLLVLQNCHSVR